MLSKVVMARIAAGVLAASGATGTAVWNLKPGEITKEEAVVLDQEWQRVVKQLEALEEGLDITYDALNSGDRGTAHDTFVSVRDLAKTVNEETVPEFQDTYAFTYLYNVSGEEPPAKDPPVKDPPAKDPPTKAPKGNAVLKAIAEAAKRWEGNSDLEVYLPKGNLSSFQLGGSKAKGDREMDMRWLKEHALILYGHPEGTTIMPQHNQDGWGSTIGLSGGGQWSTRVYFFDLTILASGANAFNTTVAWGSQAKTPYKDVRFYRCEFLDHPLETVSPTRPISVNQCAIRLYECYCEIHNSEEHWVYSRNKYTGNPSGLYDSECRAVGAQVWQEVARPDEGPTWGKGRTEIVGNVLTGYHRHPTRAGSAITISGSASDWLIQDNVIYDIDPSGWDDGTSYGGFTAWSGGKYWSLAGKAVGTGGFPERGDYANGKILVQDNIFVQANPNRAIFEIADCESIKVTGNGFYGSKGPQIGFAKTPKAHNIGGVIWAGNNLPIMDLKAFAHGITEQYLVQPDGVKIKGEFPVYEVTEDFVLDQLWKE